MRQQSNRFKQNSQFQRVMHITRDVRTQIFIILGLVASFIATFLLGFYGNMNFLLQDFFIGLSTNLIVAIIIFLLLEQGIKSLHPISEIRELPALDFIRTMSQIRAGGRIRIMETFTFLPNEHQQEFEEAVLKVVNNHARIEILIFHPYSEGALKRALQLKGKVDVKDETRKNLARFARLEKMIDSRGRASLEVRLYTALPSIAMYRMNEWAYVSLFPLGDRADLCPNLKVPMDNPLGSYSDDTFNQLWSGTLETPTIPLHQHMYLRIELPFTGPLPGTDDRFAYDEIGDDIDPGRCYVQNDNNALHAYLHNLEREQRSELLIFHVDNKIWQGEPRLLSPIDPNEATEFARACKLIEQRYEEPDGTLSAKSFIIRLQHIQEIKK